MHRTSLLFIFAVVAVAQTADSLDHSGPDNRRTIMSGSTTIKSGVMVRYKSVLSWTGRSNDPGHGLGEGGTAGGADTIHRLMSDRARGTYFGYDLVIGPADAAGGYLVTFLPPTHVGVLLERMHNGAALTLMSPPKYPAPQIVHDGDTIELDLMASPDGRSKLTDYIEILSHEPEPPAAKTTAEPRDFTVDDGPVKFDAGPRITVWKNGQQLQGGLGFTGKRGATFWITFPGQGRYILSLVPHDGFVKAGAIRDNVVSFPDAGQEYEVRFMSPIAGAGKAWNLYMMHDPTFEPDSERKSIAMGTDRLDKLLAK